MLVHLFTSLPFGQCLTKKLTDHLINMVVQYLVDSCVTWVSGGNYLAHDGTSETVPSYMMVYTSKVLAKCRVYLQRLTRICWPPLLISWIYGGDISTLIYSTVEININS